MHFHILCHAGIHKTLFICYDNDPWYLVTNFAGHLDLAGFYFSKCPANSKSPAFSSCDGGSPSLNILFLPGLEHAPPLIGSDALPMSCGDYTYFVSLVLFVNTSTFMFWRIFFNNFGAFSAFSGFFSII